MLLHDLSSDGKPDFVLATDRTGDGSIEAYRYNSLNKSYVLVWNNATLPTNMPFSALAIDDLDGDGTEEILGGTLVNSTGAIGTSVFCI
jgi:hypothetical protein